MYQSGKVRLCCCNKQPPVAKKKRGRKEGREGGKKEEGKKRERGRETGREAGFSSSSLLTAGQLWFFSVLFILGPRLKGPLLLAHSGFSAEGRGNVGQENGRGSWERRMREQRA